MISCCSFLLDLRQLWGSYCKEFQENIDKLVEVIALITSGFFIKFLLMSYSIQEFLFYPSLQVTHYLVVLKNK